MKNLPQIVSKAIVASSLLLGTSQMQAAFFDQYCCNNDNICCADTNCCNSFWANAEYLYWKIQDSPESVPLVIEGPTMYSGPPYLGEEGTTVVLGGKKLCNKWRSGGRFTLGYWFDECHSIGIEGNYFFLPEEKRKHHVFSDGLAGSSILSVPYYDVLNAEDTSSGLAYPNYYSGYASLKLNNRMQGAELNVVGQFYDSCGFNVTGLAGFRYWNYYENLTFNTSSPFVLNPGSVWFTQDKFNAENNFYGGQLGVVLDYDYCNFFINAKGKIALGAMCSELSIDGFLETDDFNPYTAVQTFPGGYFALPSNIGRHKKTNFSVIPEITVNVGYRFFDCMQIEVGYTAMYVSNVLWAGKQIDSRINPSQSSAFSYTPNPTPVGEQEPKAHLKADGLWVQGVNVGLGVQF